MSIIFTEEELIKIEALLGKEYIQVYEKIWNERINVKKYYTQVRANLSVAQGHHKTYWEYKTEEIKSVLINQSRWLNFVQLQLVGKLNDEEYQRLEKYLSANEPAFLTSIDNGGGRTE